MEILDHCENHDTKRLNMGVSSIRLAADREGGGKNS